VTLWDYILELLGLRPAAPAAPQALPAGSLSTLLIHPGPIAVRGSGPLIRTPRRRKAKPVFSAPTGAPAAPKKTALPPHKFGAPKLAKGPPPPPTERVYSEIRAALKEAELSERSYDAVKNAHGAGALINMGSAVADAAAGTLTFGLLGDPQEGVEDYVAVLSNAIENQDYHTPYERFDRAMQRAKRLARGYSGFDVADYSEDGEDYRWERLRIRHASGFYAAWEGT